MIKIIASTEVNGKKVTTSFQSKEHKPISLHDLERLIVFTNNHIDQCRMVIVNYKITYTNRGCIAGMSSKDYMRYKDRVIRQYEHLVSSINSNL